MLRKFAFAVVFTCVVALGTTAFAPTAFGCGGTGGVSGCRAVSPIPIGSLLGRFIDFYTIGRIILP
jgi:hypothetical protein